MKRDTVLQESVALLKALVMIPSLSGKEDQAATYLEEKLAAWFEGCVKRSGNNLITDIPGKEPGPTLLLCSHIDTVAPANGWTRDPFGALTEGEKIYGLGANDAGASVVSMLSAARLVGIPKVGRLLICLAAEEEAGSQGFFTVESELPRYDAAIFGEPTNMGMAVSMRGAMRAILRSRGKSCHASRPWEGKNACDQFASDMESLRKIDLTDASPWGGTTVEPTIVQGGTSPNQIPDLIETTLEIRTTPEKDNDWVVTALRNAGLDIEVTINRRRPTGGDMQSRLIKTIREALPDTGDYVFNGTCDMAFSKAPSVIIGPGRSERSHAADEFITVPELTDAIDRYTAILKSFLAPG
jgi:acetylornithine deacetylase